MSKEPTVLVVNPYITDFKLYDEWMHPVGLYMLIDLLRVNNVAVHYHNCLERSSEHSIKKYGTGKFSSREITSPDCFGALKRKYKCYGCSERSFRLYLASLPAISAIFVGSMMTYWAGGVLITIAILKELFPDVPIICGGIAVQLMPDYFKSRYPDVFWYTSTLPQAGESVVFPGVAKKLHAPLAYSLREGLQRSLPLLHGPLLASVGCPMRCSYCASALLQPRFIKRPFEVVKKELDTMVTIYNIIDYAFYDDALLVDAEALLLPLLNYIIDRKWEIRLHTPNGLHLRYVDERVLHLMKKAGFTTLRFGYESGASRNRHLTGEKADTQLLLEKLALIEQYDFKDTGVYVMGGLPDTSAEEMAMEMRVIASAGAKVKPVFLSPVPRSSLYTYYVEKFPAIANTPELHNDIHFITSLPGWGTAAVETIRILARELNGSRE